MEEIFWYEIYALLLRSNHCDGVCNCDRDVTVVVVVEIIIIIIMMMMMMMTMIIHCW